MTMARVVASIAELAGKLGGTIWQRTKAGPIVKSYAVPVDPRTPQQVAARQRLGTSSRTYAAVSEDRRQQWQQFASVDGLFVPLRGINKGQFTGQQAFIACKTAIRSQIDAQQAQTVMLFGTSPINPVPPALQTDLPPARRLDGRLETPNGPFPIVLERVRWINPISLEVQIRLTGAETIPTIAIPPGPIKDGQQGPPQIFIAGALYVSREFGQGQNNRGDFETWRGFSLWTWGNTTQIANAIDGIITVNAEYDSAAISGKYALRIGQRYAWTLILTDQYGNQAIAGTQIATYG
jgi:hypothetical protein